MKNCKQTCLCRKGQQSFQSTLTSFAPVYRPVTACQMDTATHMFHFYSFNPCNGLNYRNFDVTVSLLGRPDLEATSDSINDYLTFTGYIWLWQALSSTSVCWFVCWFCFALLQFSVDYDVLESGSTLLWFIHLLEVVRRQRRVLLSSFHTLYPRKTYESHPLLSLLLTLIKCIPKSHQIARKTSLLHTNNVW